MTPLTDSDALVVVDVLKTFVQVHQALLSTVIGKHGILKLFGFAEPIRLALVALEAAVDVSSSFPRLLVVILTHSLPFCSDMPMRRSNSFRRDTTTV